MLRRTRIVSSVIRVWSSRYFLALLVLFALALRLIGIDHGFPFIFHPDEPASINASWGINYNPNPGHFDWPHLQFYLNWVFFASVVKLRNLITIIGLKGFISGVFPVLWNSEILFYLLARVLSAIMGAAAVVPVYLSGSRLFSRSVGLLAGFCFAVMPFAVRNAHFALIDTPMLFWFCWALYFLILIYLNPKPRWFLLAGLFAGFAASTKYNGALALVVLPITYLLKCLDEQKLVVKGWHLYLLVVLTFSVGFFAGTPYAFLDFGTFTRTDGPKGALWQFTNVERASVDTHFSNLADQMLFQLPSNAGLTVFILFILGSIWWVYKSIKLRTVSKKAFLSDLTTRLVGSEKLLLVAIPAWVLILYVSGAENDRAQYFLPVYPFLALLYGYVCSGLVKAGRAFSTHRIKKTVALVLIAVIILVPFGQAVIEDITLIRDDTRVYLYRWLQSSASSEDWFYYSSKSVEPVVKELPNNSRRIKSKDEDFVGSGFVMFASQQDLVTFIEDNGKEFSRLSLVQEIQSLFRNGPDIAVYSVGR